ncbi:MAG TPA: Ig-like domain-containing protein [Isosphaeraceae bacterium]|nr:Ig-like domain-containing protein [Isosphaeraceae bacterium]
MTVPLTYSFVSQPSHGTISDFNSSTGTFIYTPTSGFVGTDTFQYQVEATGPNSTASTATSNAGTVTISVTAPLVILSKVELVTNNKDQVVKLIVIFSGPLDSTEADDKEFYRLATPGKRGSYTAKNARIIHLKKVVNTGANDSVALRPIKPFTLRKPVQLLIHGAAPSGLQDSYGRYLDGADTGQAGSDAIAILSKINVTIEAL